MSQCNDNYNRSTYNEFGEYNDFDGFMSDLQDQKEAGILCGTVVRKAYIHCYECFCDDSCWGAWE